MLVSSIATTKRVWIAPGAGYPDTSTSRWHLANGIWTADASNAWLFIPIQFPHSTSAGAWAITDIKFYIRPLPASTVFPTVALWNFQATGAGAGAVGVFASATAVGGGFQGLDLAVSAPLSNSDQFTYWLGVESASVGDWYYGALVTFASNVF
jgi:hypothetical protein